MSFKCKCDTPEWWLDTKGNKRGNVCKRCKGIINPIPPIAESIGPLLIEIDTVIRRLPFENDLERQRFCERLCETMQVDLRQRLLTWRQNQESASV